MSEATSPLADTGTPPAKSGSTLIQCQLPGGGGVIITSLNHCNLLRGTNIGKAPAPASTVLVACKFNGESILTRASDCRNIGGELQPMPGQS